MSSRTEVVENSADVRRGETRSLYRPEPDPEDRYAYGFGEAYWNAVSESFAGCARACDGAARDTERHDHFVTFLERAKKAFVSLVLQQQSEGNGDRWAFLLPAAITRNRPGIEPSTLGHYAAERFDAVLERGVGEGARGKTLYDSMVETVSATGANRRGRGTPRLRAARMRKYGLRANATTTQSGANATTTQSGGQDDDTKECVICLGELEEGEIFYVDNKYGFHCPCIVQWLKQGKETNPQTNEDWSTERMGLLQTTCGIKDEDVEQWRNERRKEREAERAGLRGEWLRLQQEQREQNLTNFFTDPDGFFDPGIFYRSLDFASEEEMREKTGGDFAYVDSATKKHAGIKRFYIKAAAEMSSSDGIGVWGDVLIYSNMCAELGYTDEKLAPETIKYAGSFVSSLGFLLGFGIPNLAINGLQRSKLLTGAMQRFKNLKWGIGLPSIMHLRQIMLKGTVTEFRWDQFENSNETYGSEILGDYKANLMSAYLNCYTIPYSYMSEQPADFSSDYVYASLDNAMTDLAVRVRTRDLSEICRVRHSYQLCLVFLAYKRIAKIYSENRRRGVPVDQVRVDELIYRKGFFTSGGTRAPFLEGSEISRELRRQMHVGEIMGTAADTGRGGGRRGSPAAASSWAGLAAVLIAAAAALVPVPGP